MIQSVNSTYFYIVQKSIIFCETPFYSMLWLFALLVSHLQHYSVLQVRYIPFRKEEFSQPYRLFMVLIFCNIINEMNGKPFFIKCY
jgi:hypothetical protein